MGVVAERSSIARVGNFDLPLSNLVVPHCAVYAMGRVYVFSEAVLGRESFEVVFDFGRASVYG